MTSGDRPRTVPRLAVDADLQLVVTDDAGAGTAASVTSGADGLRVDVDSPEVLLAALPARRDLTGPLAVAREAGVRVEVHGPRGRVAVLDPDRPSRIAGLLTGEPTLRVSPAAAGTWVRGPGRRPVLAVLAATVGVGLAVVALGRRTARR